MKKVSELWKDWMKADTGEKRHLAVKAMIDRAEDFEKEVKELKEHLQVKKLADSPIIAMIDNKPVHQDEYEALKKQVKELKKELEKCDPIASLFKKHDK